GVAVLVAIDLAIESALGSFNENLRDLAGRGSLSLHGNAMGMPPEVLKLTAETPGVRSAAPLIRGDAIFHHLQTRTTKTLMLLGLDLLESEEYEDTKIREFHIDLAPNLELLDLLGNPSNVILVRGFAERSGLKLGESFSVEISGYSRQLTVAAFLSGGP